MKLSVSLGILFLFEFVLVWYRWASHGLRESPWMALQRRGFLLSRMWFLASAKAVEAPVVVSLVWESHCRRSMILSDCRS